MPAPVYLDHAATTPLEPAVHEAMRPFFTDQFGNPSSVHALGRSARFAVEDARERVAAVVNCEPAEVVFTAGGTEANNAAIFGALRSSDSNGRGFVTSAVEHESVLMAARVLEEERHPVTILSPGPTGLIEPGRIAEAIDDATGLVSIMWVNNELGTLNPILDIAAVCRERGVIFHTDAVQAARLFAGSFGASGAHLLSISAHKFGGPKGVGALVVRDGTPLRPHQVGGSQERRRRAGTENVAAIVGLATALEEADARAETERERLRALRDRLASGIREQLGQRAHFNTPLEGPAAPHIVNVSFAGDEAPIDGEMLLLALDMAGVMVSSGSACTSGAVEPSHVLRALELPPELARATIRFSLGRTTDMADIDRALEALGETLARQGLHT